MVSIVVKDIAISMVGLEFHSKYRSHNDHDCKADNYSKLKKSEAKRNWKTRKQKYLQSKSGFTLCTALLSLSRDRRIKIKSNQTYDHLQLDQRCTGREDLCSNLKVPAQKQMHGAKLTA